MGSCWLSDEPKASSWFRLYGVRDRQPRRANINAPGPIPKGGLGTKIQSRVRVSKATLSALALLAFVGVVLMTLSPARAGHFSGATGTTGCVVVNMADNATHSFYYSAAVPQYMRDALNSIRAVSYDPTDINTVTSTDPNSGTDVVAYQQDYTVFCNQAWHSPGGSGVIGNTQCVSLVASNGRCQKHEIRFDESFVSTAPTSWRNHLACHETGHTLGLSHRVSPVNSCMWSDVTTQATDQHDRDALNANY